MQQAVGIAGLLVLSMQSCWVAFMFFVSTLWHLCTPWRHRDSARFGRYSFPVLQKSAILDARCKPWEQLHYLFFPCNLVGSPSWSLFLYYDNDVRPDSTAIVLGFDTASPLCYGKALFWVHATSRRDKSNVYVSRWLTVLSSWPFLCFCDIIFAEVFALCNMNSHEGGLRGGTGQPGHAWAVPNNSDWL